MNDEERSEETSETPETSPASEPVGSQGEGQTESELTRPASDAGDAPEPPEAPEDAQPEAPVEEPEEPEPVAPVGEPEAPVAAAEEPVAGEEPVAAEEPAAAAEGEEVEEVELPPRERPEIPGADLIPDIVADGDEFLDAEARAAAEADADARAAREREQHEEDESRPIADAAIDLAAGARYTATGKRKSAVARVILKPGDGSYAINGKPLDNYFPRETLQREIRQPLETVGYESRMDVVARMHGGGVAAQAEALRHGIARALIDADPNLRGELKRRGYLTRDPRVTERKKAGLKKARKRPQFSKR